MDIAYVQRTTLINQEIGCVIEEYGKVLAASGKCIRFGLDSSNPELPPEERETNIRWLRRELDDARLAIERLMVAIDEDA